MTYAAAIDAIEAALDRGDWRVALETALEAWRRTRLPELADAVDALGPLAAPPALPDEGWCEHAVTYDPAMAELLLARVLERDDGELRADLETEMACRAIERRLKDVPYNSRLRRASYVATWPHDPRATSILLDWYERLDDTWPNVNRPERRALQAELARIATYVVGLADARATLRLRLLGELSSQTPYVGPAQRDLSTTALAALARFAIPKATPQDLARLARLSVGHSYRPDELWSQIGQHPDDDGPRAVLADELLGRGDARGDLMGQQLGVRIERARGSIRKLITANWDAWLGPDLARLLRPRSEFARGMLHVAVVAPDRFPTSLWTRTLGHRELLAVRIVRTVDVVEPTPYALWVAALPNVHTVEVTSPRIGAALAATGVLERIRCIETSPAIAHELRTRFPVLQRKGVQMP